MLDSSVQHCLKSVHTRSYSGPCFPAFGLNTERYSVSIRIQSECGKIRTRITPNTDTFHAVLASKLLQHEAKLLLRGYKLNPCGPYRCNWLLKYSYFFALFKATVCEVDLSVFPKIYSLLLENNRLILLHGIFFRASPVSK